MGELCQLSLGDQDSRRLLADGRYELQRLNFRADSYDAAYLDLDNNGEINENDRTDLGSGIPKFTYGLTLTAAYKGFDFSIYGAGASGNKLVYGMMSISSDTWQNRPTFLYDGRWTTAGQQASGSDPEVNASSSTSSALALDYGSYPMAKSVSFGINVSF